MVKFQTFPKSFPPKTTQKARCLFSDYHVLSTVIVETLLSTRSWPVLYIYTLTFDYVGST